MKAILGIMLLFTGVSAPETFAADVSIALVPDTTPVEVPAGGSFSYTGILTNNLNQAQTVDVWVMVQVPSGLFYGPIQQWDDVFLPPNKQFQLPVVQEIGTWAPRLPYTYIAYAGEYSSAVYATDSFPFRVLPENGAVELKLHALQQSQTVAPGEQIDWTIRAFVSEEANNGLALISVDLEQDPANPELFDIPPGDSAPAGMEDFDRPDGLTNPVQGDPWGSGYGGIQAGDEGQRNLSQIGGSQNTFGVRGPCLGPNQDVCLGQDVHVDEGVGQSLSGQVMATGSFNAPATNGTYTFYIESAIANTLDQMYQHPLGVTPVKSAKINILKPGFSFHVSDSPSPEEVVFPVLSGRSAPERQIVILPPEGAVMNRLHMQFRWEPFVTPPVEYMLWIVEDDLSGDPFGPANPNPSISFPADRSEPRVVVAPALESTDRLEWDKAYAWCVTDGTPPGSGQPDVHRFTTLTLPGWLHDRTVIAYPENGDPEPGLTLLKNPAREDTPDTFQSTMMVDLDGNLVYFLNTGTALFGDLRLLNADNGSRGHLTGGRGQFFERTLDGKILWFSPEALPPEGNGAHHEGYPMPNGDLLTLTTETRIYPLGDPPVDTEKRGDVIVQLNRHTREVTWSWNMHDYFNPEHGDPDPRPNPDPADWTHSNSVVYAEDLNRIYVSVRHLSWVTAIDYATGDIIYNMGKNWDDVADFGYDPVTEEPFFTGQHAIQLLPNGNMVLYNNGNWNTPQETEALEITFIPDHIDPTDAQIAWSYTLPNYYGAQGDADRLPGGNTLSTGNSDWMLYEVNATSDLVWQMQVMYEPPATGRPEKLYRAERIPAMVYDTPCDSDGDGDLDMADFAQAQAGYTGEGPIILAFPYTLSDYDGDSDIDLFDVGEFAFWMTGPGL